MATYFDGKLDIRIGADLFESVQLVDDDGAPIGITGYSFIGKGKPSADSSVVAFTLDVQIVTAATGIISIALANATTADLVPGSGVWEIDYIVGGTILPVQSRGTYTIRRRPNA